MIRTLRAFAVAATALLLLAPPVLAQVTRGPVGPMTGVDGQPLQRQGPRKPERPAPAGVPGSRAEPELAQPADRPIGDMPPTEALFDAVNRGDLGAAKDAIGRGADIYGRNVLGLTPLELSVDLGRNDISFLLLSLRGAAGYHAGAAPSATAATKPTAADRRAQREAALQARRDQQEAARVAARATAQAPAAPRSARLFAGDGGTPVPQAGFLGFDSNR